MATAAIVGGWIVGNAAAIGAVATVASAGYGIYTSKKAADDAKDISRANAGMEAKQTAEETKRLEARNARQQSLARARAAASGAGGVSTDIYMSALEKSGREEVDWLKEVGASKYSSALSQGRTAYNQAMSGFWGGMGKVAGGVANVWSTYQDYKPETYVPPEGIYDPGFTKQ